MAISSNGKIVKNTKRVKTEKSPGSPQRSKCCSGGKQEGEQDEENTPPENRPEKRRLQGIVIDGITYTCAACRAGHRVGVCKHARERPMRATHPPGRPASGATKKIVCDCPKNCSCARKGCRCPRNCSCTQEMYLLVYVPESLQTNDAQNDEENGSWKLGEQVTTDLKGNLLTKEEVEKRHQQKLAQKAEKESSKTFPTTPAIPEGKILLQSSMPKAEPKHCCKASQPPPPPPTPREPPTPSQPVTTPLRSESAQGCFCGTTCSCAFCPQHPNNHTSQNLARQQALLFSQQQSSDPSQFMRMMPNLNTPQINSCMGQQPMFAMSHLPMKPNSASFQQAFPLAAPGYMLAYPMRGHFGKSLPQTPLEVPLEPFDMSTSQSTSSLADPNIVDSSLSFDDMCFDIGDAFVASDGPDGWHQLSHENDSQMKFPSISSPSNFDPTSWNMNMSMPINTTVDFSSPPMLPQIEPNFLDATPVVSANSISNPACPSCYTRQQVPPAPIRPPDQNPIPQLYVNPGAYISPPSQTISPQGMRDESWRLQAL